MICIKAHDMSRGSWLMASSSHLTTLNIHHVDIKSSIVDWAPMASSPYQISWKSVHPFQTYYTAETNSQVHQQMATRPLRLKYVADMNGLIRWSSLALKHKEHQIQFYFGILKKLENCEGFQISYKSISRDKGDLIILARCKERMQMDTLCISVWIALSGLV
jgi:hypothetical protein